jgi:hypothetical protein
MYESCLLRLESLDDVEKVRDVLGCLDGLHSVSLFVSSLHHCMGSAAA